MVVALRWRARRRTARALPDLAAAGDRPGAARGAVTAGADAGACAGQAPRARVLIVDDEEPLLASLRRLLGLEYEVVTAVSGEAALERLARDQRFDIVLCDVMMPGLSGVDVLERIHAGLARAGPAFRRDDRRRLHRAGHRPAGRGGQPAAGEARGRQSSSGRCSGGSATAGGDPRGCAPGFETPSAGTFRPGLRVEYRPPAWQGSVQAQAGRFRDSRRPDGRTRGRAPGRGYTALVGLTAFAALSCGCVLDWDGAPPVRPAEAAVDGVLDRGARTGLRCRSSRTRSSPRSAVVRPAPRGPARRRPASRRSALRRGGGRGRAQQRPAPPCTYVYSGKPDKLTSAQAVNSLIEQGYEVHSFVNATEQSCGLDGGHHHHDLPGAGGDQRRLAGDGGERSGPVGTGLVSGGVSRQPGHHRLARREDRRSRREYLYKVVQGTNPLAASTAVSTLAQQSWQVHARAHHVGKAYAVWLTNGVSHTLLADDVLATLEQKVNSATSGGIWTAEAFLASSGYTGWAREPLQNVYHFFSANQASTSRPGSRTPCPRPTAGRSGWSTRPASTRPG